MRKPRAAVVFALAILFLISPFFASAQGLVSCGNGTGLLAATNCQACDLISLAQNVINFLLSLSIPLAIGLFAYAGVLYFTSATNPSNINKARGIFKNALIGMLIALGAYLIVNTILHAILKPEFSDGWNSVKCSQTERPRDKEIGELLREAISGVINGPSTVINGTNNDGTNNDGTNNNGGVVIPGATFSDQDARDLLAAWSISVNKTQAQGTSLANIRQETVNTVIDLKRFCSCSIIVTGGTEPGVHADGTYSHENGYKIDIGLNSQLDGYIVYFGGTPTTRSDGAKVYTINGVEYARESDHWDILVK